MATTELKPLKKTEKWVVVGGKLMIEDSTKEHLDFLRQLENKNRSTNIYNSFSFWMSKFGQMQFYNKLQLDNSLKEHCLYSCLNDIKNATSNVKETEKLCLTNCANEAEALLDGYKKYYHEKIQSAFNYRDYNVKNSVQVNLI